MKEKDLKYYLHRFTKLRRDNKYGGAPHKPILLLSIINCFETNHFKTNQICITPELVGTFKSIWAEIVESERHHCLFSLPFFHMKSEPFWQLIPKKGFELLLKSNTKIRGLNNLRTAISFAQIDVELESLLRNENERQILKIAILEKYFPYFSNSSSSNNGYINTIKSEILNEPSEEYKQRLFALQEQLNDDEFEEEKFIRSHLFKEQVHLSYDNSCSISRLKVEVTSNASLIDACHIIPFSHSFDDTISNGFALNPTLHRAFDRGLIAIDENYCVLVSDSFRESEKSEHSIRQYKGVEIFQPTKATHIPKIENFLWHRENIFIP